MNTIRIQHENTKMIAHRGVSGLEKENTLAAFVAAGNRSYWGVETDVHRTADGKMILIHDSRTKRVAGVDIRVEETDFDTLRDIILLDIDGQTPRNDLRLPSLKEYIRICKKYEKVCILELKNLFSEEEILQILAEIREEEYLDQVVFISFHSENLVIIRKLCPEQRIQYLVNQFDDQLLSLLKEQKFDLDIDYHALTGDIVKRLHENGISVNCWTVNRPEAAQELISWGVDQITTNILE